jgi:hypothetical protein
MVARERGGGSLGLRVGIGRVCLQEIRQALPAEYLLGRGAKGLRRLIGEGFSTYICRSRLRRG